MPKVLGAQLNAFCDSKMYEIKIVRILHANYWAVRDWMNPKAKIFGGFQRHRRRHAEVFGGPNPTCPPLPFLYLPFFSLPLISPPFPSISPAEGEFGAFYSLKI